MNYSDSTLYLAHLPLTCNLSTWEIRRPTQMPDACVPCSLMCHIYLYKLFYVAFSMDFCLKTSNLIFIFLNSQSNEMLDFGSLVKRSLGLSKETSFYQSRQQLPCLQIAEGSQFSFKDSISIISSCFVIL